MKYALLIVGLFISFTTSAQNEFKKEEQAVKAVLDLFFASVQEQDTTKFKQAMDLNGHLYIYSDVTTPNKYGVDSFKNALKRLRSQNKTEETPLSFDIKVRKGMATAWVPYRFKVNDEFSHCGVNNFILMKKADVWKIVNVSFTMEKEGCEALGNEQR